MNLTKYKGFDIEYNHYKWGEANIISSVDEYNELAKFFFELGSLQLTKKGHLVKQFPSCKGAVVSNLNEISSNSHEFIGIINNRMYRFVFKPYKIDQKTGQFVTNDLTGRDALRIIKAKCAEKGINLNDYAIINGAEVKKTIPSAWIKFADLKPIMLELLCSTGIKNCYHIDINSAYPAGLCAEYPEFRPIYEEFYNNRKVDPECKCVLNYSIGAMQSLKLSSSHAKWAHLSKTAIEWTIKKLKWLTRELQARGYLVLAYNTDGVWFHGDSEDAIHTIEGEGNGLGEWKLDHKAEILRFKSAGSYEFIEDGIYYPVVRGLTRLDKIKPRNEWQWGDIFQTNVIKFGWIGNQLVAIDCVEHKEIEEWL